MPSIEWNKKWGQKLSRFVGRKKKYHYGDQWGDPEATGLSRWIQRIGGDRRSPGDLSKVVEYYIKPYVTQNTVALEIGAGGGRWTRYLLAAKEIVIVDLNAEFFPYLEERFKDYSSKFRFYQTSGYEIDGIEANYVDFLFTFGTFVHIEPEGISTYLGAIKRVLKPGGIAVIQYSDKTKKRARSSAVFSDMNPGKMEAFVSEHGFRFLEHDTTLLSHSSIAVIQKSE